MSIKREQFFPVFYKKEELEITLCRVIRKENSGLNTKKEGDSDQLFPSLTNKTNYKPI